MKTQYIIFMALMLCASMGLVIAEENSSANDTAIPTLYAINDTNVSFSNVSVETSDDEVHSGFRYGWEKFKLNFIRNETKHAERELQLARWKLAEAKFKARNGNFDGAEKALEDHDKLIADIQSKIERMQNGSLTPGLDRALEVHGERLSSLRLLLESSNLTDQQRAKIEMRVSKLENNTEHLSELRVEIENRGEDRLQRLENRTERVNESGDRVRERIENRSRNGSNDSSEDDSSEDDSSDDFAEDDNSTDDSVDSESSGGSVNQSS
ncbi:hypothetical protein KA107_00425 [Candidatus Pacearchaeota archaeon]|nr:hypothetical protein [Candidatus Pacearchaeota archaeon]